MDGAPRSARSPPGGVQARTGISGESCSRARPAAYLSACRLPGDPSTPANTRRTRDTARLLPDGSVSSSKPLSASEILPRGRFFGRAGRIGRARSRPVGRPGGLPAGPSQVCGSIFLDSSSQILLTSNYEQLLKEGDYHDQEPGEPPVVGTQRAVAERARRRARPDGPQSRAAHAGRRAAGVNE